MNAWRYLFPGVLAMLLFVAFPLVYTVQIGFTNYSASNLLSEDRARGYLLEQADVSEARAYGFSLHAPGADAARRGRQVHPLCIRAPEPGFTANRCCSDAAIGGG